MDHYECGALSRHAISLCSEKESLRNLVNILNGSVFCPNPEPLSKGSGKEERHHRQCLHHFLGLLDSNKRQNLLES